jgi:hypothetical protein
MTTQHMHIYKHVPSYIIIIIIIIIIQLFTYLKVFPLQAWVA